mgnify:CR=1 FL=1|tara:strand:+ start:58 stop:1209 length:1152 start_codon:yes stop_codon:yes gene_type:complete
MEEKVESTNEATNMPKKRGRKPKNSTENLQSKEVEEKIPKKRGRKPKNKSPEDLVEKIPKKRGRKPKEKVYSIKELPKTFYEENKNETLILHLPINLGEKENEPKPLESSHTNNLSIEEEETSNSEYKLPTQVNFLEDNIDTKINENSHLLDNDTSNNQSNNNISKEITNNNKAWEVDQRNANKVLKKNLRNILYEFIDSNKDKAWPEKTNISCWWCCHKFDNTPCSLPYKCKKDKFYVKGVFCSFNCAASYNFSLNDDDVFERYSLLNLMYKKLYYRKFIKISLAPPRESLKMFGGYLSIEEFRENCLNNDKLFNIIDPPLISIIPKIEESVNHNKEFGNTLRLNVNENILQKTQDTLKLKRKKPVFNPNNSLQSFMDLKII